jgi:hypothetical protein
MPKFYFKITDKEGSHSDADGFDFPDMKSAVGAAETALAEMALDGLPISPNDRLSIEVEDEKHEPVLAMRLVLQVDVPAMYDDRDE